MEIKPKGFTLKIENPYSRSTTRNERTQPYLLRPVLQVADHQTHMHHMCGLNRNAIPQGCTDGKL
jgi:hypothetical protein